MQFKCRIIYTLQGPLKCHGLMVVSTALPLRPWFDSHFVWTKVVFFLGGALSSLSLLALSTISTIISPWDLVSYIQVCSVPIGSMP